MKVYRILGRRARLVSFPDGNDKVLPACTIFQASPSNVSVYRLLKMRPPACRELSGEDIPERFRNTPPNEDIVVVID